MAGYAASSHWLLAVPNELGSAKAMVDKFGAAIKDKGVAGAEVSAWDVPWMKVGTLDSLLALGDDLARADSFAEGVVRKVERQVVDSYTATRLAEAAKSAKSAVGGDDRAAASFPPLELRVRGQPVTEYVRRFAWDVEQYDPKEPLPDLLRRLTSAADKIEGDIRAVSGAYAEKRGALTAIERRRGGNLLVGGLEEVITPAALDAAGAEFVSPDSEYLSTVVVVVPRAAEEAWLASYESLDAASVPLGSDPANRDAVRGSPVVPNSAVRVAEDRDGYALYTVVILKRFSDSFRAACRERRFTVRDFTYEPRAGAGAAAAAAALEADVAVALAALRDAATRAYGEALATWLHVKAVRAFVEAVLRYGLPVNFVAVLVRAGAVRAAGGAGAVRRLLDGVKAAWHGLAAAGGAGDDFGYGDGSSGKAAAAADAAMVIPGVSDGAAGGAARFPFVFLDFDVRGDTAAAAASSSGGGR